MKSVVIGKPGGNFEVVERPTPQPAAGRFVSGSKPVGFVIAMPS